LTDSTFRSRSPAVSGWPARCSFDPMPFLDALTTELHERGGRLITGRRVHAASTAGGPGR
jgi:hypothetical protein